MSHRRIHHARRHQITQWIGMDTYIKPRTEEIINLLSYRTKKQDKQIKLQVVGR